ncbi:hypothetical protein XANCAGTX0491_006156 [Xanthoria calcicola]
MSPVPVPRSGWDGPRRNDHERDRSSGRRRNNHGKHHMDDSRSPYRAQSRSRSPYGEKRNMRGDRSYSRSPKRRRRRHSELPSPYRQDRLDEFNRCNPRGRNPSSSPSPGGGHSDSRSPRDHKRSRRLPSVSLSPPPKCKRSIRPLPSQNDAYKGTSTALDKPSSTSPGPAPEKQKPNYAPSGLLAAETNTVANTSIVLKYHEPPETRLPPSSQPYLLYIFKASDLLSKLTLNERSCWLFGRERIVADVPVEHPSASKQHAVLQFRHVVKKDEFGDKRGGVGLYLLDLDSANGSFLNGERVEGRRYVEVRHGDVLRWGESSREYVVLVPPKEMVAK